MVAADLVTAATADAADLAAAATAAAAATDAAPWPPPPPPRAWPLFSTVPDAPMYVAFVTITCRNCS